MRCRLWWGAVPAALLSACVTTGESTVEAELTRRQAETAVAVAEAMPARAVFIARGQEVVVEPPDGYCLDAETIAVNDSAAFTMVSECLTEQTPEPQESGDAQEPVEINLPRAFPGILTMSISAQPAFGTSPRALSEFETLLNSPEGLQLMSRTGQKPGEVIGTRRIGGALYVLVEGPGTADGLLSRRFWRAFAGISDRLVLVTVSGFRDSEVSDEAMLGFLVRQMRRLRRANDMPAVPEETRIIEAAAVPTPAPEAAPSGQIALESAPSDAAPASAPRAPGNPRRG